MNRSQSVGGGGRGTAETAPTRAEGTEPRGMRLDESGQPGGWQPGAG